MATISPKSRSQPPKPSGKPERRNPPANAQTQKAPPEVVDPIWLVKAIGLTLLAALVCGYLTLCLLFYQGQWQLVLHPSRSTLAPANITGAPFQTVHFGVDETASPQLTGWLIPAAPDARYAAYTVFYLPGGDGSLADATPTLSALHDIGINIFAFDYRGYGQSSPTRPNQKRMTEDAASAWQYLTVSRALPGSHVILFGTGVGGALAAQLASSHAEVPAIILEAPRPDVIQSVLADPRTKSLPVHLLFHENFEIATPTATLKTPKLFLLSPGPADSTATTPGIDRLTSLAAPPKMISTLSAADRSGPKYREEIVRFLDQSLR